VAATTTPTAWLERNIDGNWEKFYDFSINPIETIKDEFNTSV
jgi:hypothetical protein